jgi:hypothetical protein
VLRQHVAGALFSLGAAFGRLGRIEEAVAAYQQVIDRYRDDTTPALHESVALARTFVQRIRDAQETLISRLFRDRVEFCSGLVDLVVC